MYVVMRETHLKAASSLSTTKVAEEETSKNTPATPRLLAAAHYTGTTPCVAFAIEKFTRVRELRVCIIFFKYIKTCVLV